MGCLAGHLVWFAFCFVRRPSWLHEPDDCYGLLGLFAGIIDANQLFAVCQHHRILLDFLDCLGKLNDVPADIHQVEGP